MLTLKTTALLAGSALVLTAGAIGPVSSASAAPSASAVVANVVRDAPKYSDDQFLLGVLFGTGRVASALGVDIADQTPLPEDFDQEAAQLVQEFRTARPDVADAAVTSFRSGDPIRVHEAVKSVQRSFQETYAEGSPAIDNGALCAAINLVLAGNFAVAINLAVAVDVAFVTWVVTAQAENDADAQVISARLADLGLE